MPEPDSKSPRAGLVQLVCNAIGENEAFLWEYARDVYDETISLVNDAIDALISASSSPTASADYTERAWTFFSYHALLPLANAMVVDLFVGNLPGCFMLLRLLLETLGKSWIADSTHADLPFFAERLQALEEEHEGASTSRTLRRASQSLGLGNDIIALWGDLSRNWLHVPGYSRKIVDTVNATGSVPAWALAIPMSYGATDLEAIRQFGVSVGRFRLILASALSVAGRGHSGGD